MRGHEINNIINNIMSLPSSYLYDLYTVEPRQPKWLGGERKIRVIENSNYRGSSYRG